MLSGRCRTCKTHISTRYPLIEILTAFIFVLLFIKFGLEKVYFFYIIMVGYIIVLSFIDIDKKVVPDGIVIYLLATGLILNAFELKSNSGIIDGIVGAIAAGAVFYLLGFFSGGKMGEGDIKLFMALGFCFGAKDIFNITLYSFIAGGVAAAFLLTSGMSKRKDKIAFVPFAGLGLIISALLS